MKITEDAAQNKVAHVSKWNPCNFRGLLHAEHPCHGCGSHAEVVFPSLVEGRRVEAICKLAKVSADTQRA